MIQTSDVATAAEIMQAGGVIAYPTETLPGLGCLASKEESVRRILRIKQRPEHKGLILLVSSIEQLQPWVAPLDENILARLKQKSEIATTWLLPTGKHKHPLLQGDHDKLAVRITTHPTAIKLCNLLDQAIVSTSINLAGEAPASKLADIPPAILNQLDLVLSGSDGTGKPSKIMDILTTEEVR